MRSKSEKCNSQERAAGGRGTVDVCDEGEVYFPIAEGEPELQVRDLVDVCLDKRVVAHRRR